MTSDTTAAPAAETKLDRRRAKAQATATNAETAQRRISDLDTQLAGNAARTRDDEAALRRARDEVARSVRTARLTPAVPIVSNSAVEVHTRTDGTVVVPLRGAVEADSAPQVPQTLVHTVRRVRPLRLVVDLGSVSTLDALHRGAIAAVMTLADDYQVAIFIENPPPAVEAGLIAAGVGRDRIRHT